MLCRIVVVWPEVAGKSRSPMWGPMYRLSVCLCCLLPGMLLVHGHWEPAAQVQ